MSVFSCMMLEVNFGATPVLPQGVAGVDVNGLLRANHTYGNEGIADDYSKADNKE